jgi:hypothetical protein
MRVEQHQPRLDRVLQQPAQRQSHPRHRQHLIAGLEQLAIKQPSLTQVGCNQQHVAAW